MSFTHLQVRSGYSLLESTNTIEKLVEKASELQFGALALTDQHVLYGTIPFYNTCKRYGIKPIIGMIAIIIDVDGNEEQCILLAKNNQGYKQLMKISTLIQTNKQAGIDFDQIQSLTNHLICILPVSNSKKLSSLLNETTHEEAKLYINKWRGLFNQEDFYLGIQDHGLASERGLHNSIKAFHETDEVPVVAINDVRYINAEDHIAYDCLQAIKNDERWTLSNKDHVLKQRHLRSAIEMDQLFSSFWPEVIKETETIKEKCNVSFDFKSRMMPSFPVPDEVEGHTYLEELCWKKVGEKFRPVTKEAEERLQYELTVINSMGFSDYFLIVWDFIAFAKKNHILVGPGRGSAAGSLVAYVLGITDVDPIKYDLLFERFLNPERVTMPDIDIDFSDYRRDEVINYVRNRYGQEHVAQIITFGTFGARSLLRELIKTIGIDQQDAAFLLSKIPVQANKTLKEHINASTDLQQYIKQSKQLRVLFTIAIKLEGLPRHISTHAAGVVISEEPLNEHVPLTIGSNEMNLTQYPMNDLEAIGLLKIDFLGLRNLTLLEHIIKAITLSANKTVTLRNIPENDLKTYELLQMGKTNGIFQLESRGMKQVLTKLKPTSFEDVVAVNALFRPGPMEHIPTYINRKHNVEKTSYPHPDLEPILKRTHGVLIYQEQIMQIAYKLAGYSLGEADIFRRAISKKQQEIMDKQQDIFIRGCIANGYQKEIAEKIFLWIVKFSNYGFNRSHAVAYSKISYQLAYLKTHYPAHFFAELLSSVTNQQEKISQYIKEATDLKLTISPPSINNSFKGYTVERDSIRMGLLSIKGVGHQVVNEIILARKERPFTNLFDFCLRVSLKKVKRQTMELLIMAGAFDETHSNRASLLASIDQAIDQGELFREFNDQPSLLQNTIELKETYVDIADFSQMEKLHDEKELLGIYVTDHPLKKYRRKLRLNGFVTLKSAENLGGKKAIKSAVIIQSIKKIRTKRGDPMAFITIGDETTEMDAVVFPELYRKENSWLKEEMLVFINGNIDVRNNRNQWILSQINIFDEGVLNINRQRLFIKLIEEDSKEALQEIGRIGTIHPGNIPIFIYHKGRKKTYRLAENYNVSSSQECLQALINYFGKSNVVLEG